MKPQKDTEAQRPTFSWVGTLKPPGKRKKEEKTDGGNERGGSERDWDRNVESQRTTGVRDIVEIKCEKKKVEGSRETALISPSMY